MSPRSCTVEGCGRTHSARGWCRTHYTRWRRHGDPEYTAVASRFDSIFDRLIRYTLIGDDCWEWVGTRLPKGYGLLGHPEDRSRLAHRLWYEELRGPIPDGLHIDHLCRNTSCVNPWHLEPVTVRENVRRQYEWI